MINDYHAVRAAKALREYPDNMVHSLAADVELKALEAGIKVEDIAVLYESLKRQEPKIHGVMMQDGLGVLDNPQ